MRTRRGVLAAVLTVGILALSPVAEADLELGQWVIRKGNTIEVLGPDPSVDLVAIVDAIGDAASDNRYLIKLGPGVYDLGPSQTLGLKEYVDLMGSGQETTEIVGSNEMTSSFYDCDTGFPSVLTAPDNSVVSHLTLTLDSSSSDQAYVLCTQGSPTIRSVTARATSVSGAGDRHGFHVADGSPELTDITSIIDGGESVFTFYCKNATSRVSRASLTSKNGAVRNRALWMVGTCSLEMRDALFYAEESPTNRGIYVQTGGSLDIAQGLIEVSGTGTNTGVYAIGDADILLHDVQVRSSGGSFNDGFDLRDDSRLRLFRGSVGGDSGSVRNFSTKKVIVSQSTLFQPVNGSGTFACVASGDGDGNLLMPDCS